MHNINQICPICGRPFGSFMEDHHLKPKTYRTRTKEVLDKDNLITIHKMCHQKIHSTFSEDQLLKYYHTVDRIVKHEEIQKFIKWISKKDVDFYDKNNDTQNRKRKRKR